MVVTFAAARKSVGAQPPELSPAAPIVDINDDRNMLGYRK